MTTRSREQYEKRNTTVAVLDMKQNRQKVQFLMLLGFKKNNWPVFYKRVKNSLDDFFSFVTFLFLLFLIRKKVPKELTKLIDFIESDLQRLKNNYRDIAGFDMTFDEYRDLCRKKWKM